MIAPLPRHDFYAAVHKGLRRNQALLLIELGHADWTDPKEIDRLRFAVARQLVVSRQHLHHEDVFIRPLIDAAASAEALRIDGDHEHHRATFDALAALLERLAVAPAEAPGIGKKLYLAFAEFVAEDFAHMGYEESVILPLLHARFSDEELIAVHQRLVAAIAPDEFLDAVRFMLPALSRVERAGLLSAMRADMPVEVFDMVLAAIQPHLAADVWHALVADLSEMAHAA